LRNKTGRKRNEKKYLFLKRTLSISVIMGGEQGWPRLWMRGLHGLLKTLYVHVHIVWMELQLFHIAGFDRIVVLWSWTLWQWLNRYSPYTSLWYCSFTLVWLEHPHCPL
jgi:hypothetical protein